MTSIFNENWAYFVSWGGNKRDIPVLFLDSVLVRLSQASKWWFSRFYIILILVIMADVDIYVGNNTLIDPEVYQLWVNGFSGKKLTLTNWWAILCDHVL